MIKSLQDSQSDTSESSPSEDEDDLSESSIKSCIEKVYSKLEGLTFKGTFEREVKLATIRPVYKVKDRLANDLLAEVCCSMSAFEKKIGGKNLERNYQIR